MRTKPSDFYNEKTRFLQPLLEYAYSLDYEEEPDYERIIFMFKKIVLDMNEVPMKVFDWSKDQKDKI